MPKKIEEPVLVVEYRGKVAGWIGSVHGCKVRGDAEWIASAKEASLMQAEFDLHEGHVHLIADLDDPVNAAGAFAAFAWMAKERIRVLKAPEGLLDELMLLAEPEESLIYDFEANRELTDEERDYYETHYYVEMENGEDVWIPLVGINSHKWTDALKDVVNT